MTKSSTSFQRRKEQKYYRYKSKEKLSKRGANMPDKNWQFELEEYIR